MNAREVRRVIGDVPYMSLAQGERIMEFIRRNRPREILELGFCHGVSTCYMAAALAEQSGGSITTIDLETARHLEPNVEELLTRIGQRERVTCCYEPTSYNWRLMKLLEEGAVPRFDFCYLDGAHNWFVDGFAFFLVDRLLRPDGWIIFDDLHWTYARSLTLAKTDMVKAMPEEEREAPQVQKVFDLLVKSHPCYGEFRTEDGWGYAHKVSASAAELPPVRREYVIKQVPIPWAKLAARMKRYGWSAGKTGG